MTDVKICEMFPVNFCREKFAFTTFKLLEEFSMLFLRYLKEWEQQPQEVSFH